MIPSHFRKIQKKDWNSTGRPGDAVVVNNRGAGQYIVHCAGTREWWEARWGDIGKYEGDRVSDLPAVDQRAILRRICEEDDPIRSGNKHWRRRFMNESAVGNVIAEGVLPHLWAGQTDDDVR